MQQILILSVVIGLLVCPFIAFRYSASKYKKENASRLKAYLYFLSITSAPILIYTLICLSMVGVEELSGKAIIEESFARSFIIIAGFGLLLLLNLSVIFIFYLIKSKRDKKI
ncbi:MAG: hypothetical protein GTN99_06585 [Candidatus Dadabacteria bacterium]|nr:hypothetical protein [Candidatus Dadabacteria bacterium]